VTAFTRFTQFKHGTTCDDFAAMRQEAFQHLLQIQQLRLTIDDLAEAQSLPHAIAVDDGRLLRRHAPGLARGDEPGVGPAREGRLLVALLGGAQPGGAVLLGSTHPADYPINARDNTSKALMDAQHWKNSEGVDEAASRTLAYQRLILVDQAHDVRVFGHGIIDGQGKLLRTETCRPQLVLIRNSSNVVFENVELRDPAFFNTNILMSDHVTYRGVKIINDPSVPNTDGFDPDSFEPDLIAAVRRILAVPSPTAEITIPK